MTVDEYLRALGASPPAPIYLFCPGKAARARDLSFEPFLVEQALERTLALYVDPATRDMAYAAFYADETPAKSIVMEAQTLPFLTDRRVVLVRGAERYFTDSSGNTLVPYLEDPNETTLLLIVSSKLDRRTKFFKACEKRGVVVEFPELSRIDVQQWVRARVAEQGKTIAGDAVQEIVQRAGTRLSDVNNALNVIYGFAGTRQHIGLDDVLAACADVAEEIVWNLTDAIARSDGHGALTSLRRLLDMNKHPDELMGTLNWMLNMAYAVAIAGSATPTISSFVADKVRPLAKRLGVRRIRAAFALCTDTHFMLRSTGVDGTLALELLIIKLANPQGRPQSA